jgi:short-subunit dehydrogenase
MQHRLALITGATSGIGKATAELFAQKGLDLILSGRNQRELEYLQESLSKQVNVQIIQADLAQAEGRERIIDVLHAQVPDLVINNAGLGLYGGALTYSTEEQVNILEVNGRAVLELTLEAARALISINKKGVILNVSSSAAFQVLPNMTVYSASKAFVNHFSQAFDFEVKNDGIRVLTLCPGMVATHFQTRAGGKLDEQQAGVMTPSFVAEQIWKQIARLDPLCIIDWKYRLLTLLSFLLPKSWIAATVELNIAKRMTIPRTLIKMEK